MIPIIAEDFPDIAQRLKEIEADPLEQPLPDPAAAAIEQAYSYWSPDYDPA
jgi:hypothetical protein